MKILSLRISENTCQNSVALLKKSLKIIFQKYILKKILHNVDKHTFKQLCLFSAVRLKNETNNYRKTKIFHCISYKL